MFRAIERASLLAKWSASYRGGDKDFLITKWEAINAIQKSEYVPFGGGMIYNESERKKVVTLKNEVKSEFEVDNHLPSILHKIAMKLLVPDTRIMKNAAVAVEGYDLLKKNKELIVEELNFWETHKTSITYQFDSTSHSVNSTSRSVDSTSEMGNDLVKRAVLHEYGIQYNTYARNTHPLHELKSGAQKRY